VNAKLYREFESEYLIHKVQKACAVLPFRGVQLSEPLFLDYRSRSVWLQAPWLLWGRKIGRLSHLNRQRGIFGLQLGMQMNKAINEVRAIHVELL
jgi:hypothetical protein